MALPESQTSVQRTRVCELQARVSEVPFWWHRIDLGHGVVTPGVDDSRGRLKRLRLPLDLSGRSVLDVGAWDGFFSFEAERRGARRVVACDRWDSTTGGAAPTGFRIARDALDSKVEELPGGIEGADSRALGTFDLVLCLGVLYHVTDPFDTIQRLRALTGTLLILDTELDATFFPRPAMAFYPGKSLRGDPTNWFAPNLSGLRAMLMEVGFSRVEVVWRMGLAARVGRACRDTRQHGMGLFAGVQRDRVIVHATV